MFNAIKVTYINYRRKYVFFVKKQKKKLWRQICEEIVLNISTKWESGKVGLS